jgi:hypothetical protein
MASPEKIAVRSGNFTIQGFEGRRRIAIAD